jgi:hypothetical protein
MLAYHHGEGAYERGRARTSRWAVKRSAETEWRTRPDFPKQFTVTKRARVVEPLIMGADDDRRAHTWTFS